MIAIVDYGVGNLYSLTCSLAHIGVAAVITRDEATLRSAEKIILPGVGAFGDAADKLRALKLDGILKEQAMLGKPLMGVCLGMQLLFEQGLEYGAHEGLGLIRGRVVPLAPDAKGLKVPHMGWNSLDIRRPEDPLVTNVHQGDYVYYVHSFYATDCDDALIATSQYGAAIAGVVRNGNVCGTQFHPEKSGTVRAFHTCILCKGGRVMLIYPAIDLRGGRVVRLQQGDYDQMTVYNGDPVEIAEGFVRMGATCLHAVDLDGAKDGSPQNRAVIAQLCKLPLFIEMAEECETRLILRRRWALGVNRVILGTVAVTDFDFTTRMSKRFGDQLAWGWTRRWFGCHPRMENRDGAFQL